MVEFSFQKAATNSYEPWVKENTLVQRHVVKEAAYLMMARKQTQQESRKKAWFHNISFIHEHIIGFSSVTMTTSRFNYLILFNF